MDEKVRTTDKYITYAAMNASIFLFIPLILYLMAVAAFMYHMNQSNSPASIRYLAEAAHHAQKIGQSGYMKTCLLALDHSREPSPAITQGKVDNCLNIVNERAENQPLNVAQKTAIETTLGTQ